MSKYDRYESEKKIIQAKGLSADEYDKEIRDLARRLKL